MNIRDRIEALLSHLNRGVYEREPAIQLALLTAIAGESIFMLGAPGVAKSLSLDGSSWHSRMLVPSSI